MENRSNDSQKQETGSSGAKSGARNMTVGNPARVILLFAIPMVLSNLLQQLYNIADSLIVGNFLGTDALAAVGNVGAVTAVLVQLASGLALGGSIVISQYFGAGKLVKVKECATTMIIFSGFLGLVLTVVMLLAAGTVLKLINTPAEIMDYSVEYLRIYFIGCVPVFLYNAFNGVYVAMGNSRTPLYFLAVSAVLNVALDILFIVVLDMGVGGAAWATTLSQSVAAVCAAVNLPGKIKALNITGKARVFDGAVLLTMLKFALPAALQQSIVSVGSVIVQASINGFGPVVIAGCTAASKVINLASSIPINYSNAYSNYVGQNIGAGRQERITPGLRASILVCGGISLVMTILLEVFAEPVTGMFVNGDSVAEVIAVGAVYIRVVAAFMVVFSVFMMIKATFKGSGDMLWFIITTLTSFFIRLFLTVGLARTLGVDVIWWSICIGWVIALGLSVWRYRQGGWKNKGIVK